MEVTRRLPHHHFSSVLKETEVTIDRDEDHITWTMTKNSNKPKKKWNEHSNLEESVQKIRFKTEHLQEYVLTDLE